MTWHWCLNNKFCHTKKDGHYSFFWYLLIVEGGKYAKKKNIHCWEKYPLPIFHKWWKNYNKKNEFKKKHHLVRFWKNRRGIFFSTVQILSYSTPNTLKHVGKCFILFSNIHEKCFFNHLLIFRWQYTHVVK